jgi:hypothetical protein
MKITPLYFTNTILDDHRATRGALRRCFWVGDLNEKFVRAIPVRQWLDFAPAAKGWSDGLRRSIKMVSWTAGLNRKTAVSGVSAL